MNKAPNTTRAEIDETKLTNDSGSTQISSSPIAFNNAHRPEASILQGSVNSTLIRENSLGGPLPAYGLIGRLRLNRRIKANFENATAARVSAPAELPHHFINASNASAEAVSHSQVANSALDENKHPELPLAQEIALSLGHRTGKAIKFTKHYISETEDDSDLEELSLAQTRNAWKEKVQIAVALANSVNEEKVDELKKSHRKEAKTCLLIMSALTFAACCGTGLICYRAGVKSGESTSYIEKSARQIKRGWNG